jgi:catechol 2,3-dioxygenase-like lactoylglutathione lyase family enzyme
MSLGKSKIIAFVPTNHRERSRVFFQSTLGLKLVSEDPFAMVFDAHGTMLRVVTVGDFSPLPFTILGWDVSDIEGTARKLAAAGVSFERYPGMQQDPTGIWTSPSGARVAWFKDPDGNVLSISEASSTSHPRSRP